MEMTQRASIRVDRGSIKFDGYLAEGAGLPDPRAWAGPEILVEQNSEIRIETARGVWLSHGDACTERVFRAGWVAVETKLGAFASSSSRKMLPKQSCFPSVIAEDGQRTPGPKFEIESRGPGQSVLPEKYT